MTTNERIARGLTAADALADAVEAYERCEHRYVDCEHFYPMCDRLAEYRKIRAVRPPEAILGEKGD